MNLREIYIKNFQKRKAVIILMVDESGHLTTHWAIPDSSEKVVSLVGVEKSIVLHKDKMTLSTKHNIPTYLVHYSNCEPIDFADVQKGIYGVKDFELIVNNNMAEQVFKSSNKSKLSDEGKIIIVVVLLVSLVLGYFINTKLEDLSRDLQPEPAPVVVEDEFTIGQ